MVDIHYILGIWRSHLQLTFLLFRKDFTDHLVEIPLYYLVDPPTSPANEKIYETVKQLIDELNKFEAVNVQVEVLSGELLADSRESAKDYRQDYQEISESDPDESDVQAYLQRTLYKPKFDLAIVSNSSELNLNLSDLLKPYQHQLAVYFQDLALTPVDQHERWDKYNDAFANNYIDVSPELKEKLSEVDLAHPLKQLTLGAFSYGDRYLNSKAPVMEVISLD